MTMPQPPKSNLPNDSSKRPVRPVRPIDTTDVVVTPGGLRPRSLVYQLQPGQHISTKGGRVLIIDTATGNVVKDLGESATAAGSEEPSPIKPSAAVPGIPDTGWIENSQWRNGGAEPIVYFSTTWVVPPAPASSDGQLIYFFNGMQPDSGAHILQPVLQWGSGFAGGGSYWTITNWYADGQGGPAVFQPLVQVNTGEVLQGVMTCTGKSGSGFNYKSSFVGFPQTDVTVTDVDELTWAYETMECYSLSNCSDYPNAPCTAMYDIQIKTGTPGTSGTDASISWATVTNFTDCNQKVVVASNASPGGAVYLFYGKLPLADSIVSAVSRSSNLLDAFAVGTDHKVYTAAWAPGDASWQGWWSILNFVTAPGTSVYAVSRAPNYLDIFAVGTDHGVYTAAWAPGDTSWKGWWRVGNLTVAPGTSVFGISRSLNHLDIFAVGSDQGIYTAAWEPDFTDGWHGWWRIQSGSAAPGTTVFGVSRETDYLDIFAVGSDQGIYTASWQPSFTGWHGWERIQSGVAAPGTSVSAVSRSPGFLDIFCVGADLGTYTAAWAPGDTAWQGWWRIQNGSAGPNSSVFGVSRSANLLDIFVVGGDKGLYTAAWAPGDTSWKGWWRIQNGSGAPGTSIYPVSRSANQLDVFAVGTDHGIYTAAWQPSFTSWEGWWRIQGGTSA
jgi:hypothetical protein